MGAVVSRQTITATGQYVLVEAGTGYGQGGWQIAVVGSSWTGSGVLKQRTSPPGSAVALGSAITYYLVTDGSASSAAITAAANVIVQDVGSDLYFDYTHTSGTVTITVMAAGELIGSEEGLLPVLNPAFTGTMTGPAVTLTGALTYGTKMVSTTALATPSALAATAFNAFASTVSGATLMGFGTTADVTLKNRAGTDVLKIGPNTTAVVCAGAVTSTGDLTVGASTFVVTAATGAVVSVNDISAGNNIQITTSTAALRMKGSAGVFSAINVSGADVMQFNPAEGGVKFSLSATQATFTTPLAITGALTGVTSIAISGAATTQAAGVLSLGNTTQATVGAAGGASALPATPTGYLKTYIGATQYVIPYYAQA